MQDCSLSSENLDHNQLNGHVQLNVHGVRSRFVVQIILLNSKQQIKEKKRAKSEPMPDFNPASLKEKGWQRAYTLEVPGEGLKKRPKTDLNGHLSCCLMCQGYNPKGGNLKSDMNRSDPPPFTFCMTRSQRLFIAHVIHSCVCTKHSTSPSFGATIRRWTFYIFVCKTRDTFFTFLNGLIHGLDIVWCDDSAAH